MFRIHKFLIGLFITTNLSVCAQEPDSSFTRENLQRYTPSVLMRKGQWELKLFNNLYTQTAGYDAEGRRSNFGSRSTYNTLLAQSLFGFRPRISFGVDAWVKSVHLGTEGSSPLDVFGIGSSSVSRTALSAIGPKVKLAPLRSAPRLAVQSALLIPIAPDQEGVSNGRPFLASDSYLWLTQVFYDHAITRRVQVFAQVAPWLYYHAKPVANEGSRLVLSTPVTVFITWFASERLSLSVQQEYWPTWGGAGLSAWFRQEGLGAKFQLFPGLLELEASTTVFSNGRNSGAGSTHNLGVRILR
jgi:hypothetical protein